MKGEGWWVVGRGSWVHGEGGVGVVRLYLYRA